MLVDLGECDLCVWLIFSLLLVDGLTAVSATVPGTMIPIICATVIVVAMAVGSYYLVKLLKHDKTA